MSFVQFETPAPIAVVLDLYVADVRLVAADRADTVVEVRPSDPARAADVKAAEATRVAYDEATRTLTVTTRKPRGRFVSFGKRPESVDLLVQLPTDSTVRAEADLGDCTADGTLGAVALKTGLGAVHLAHTGPLHVRTGLGEVTVDTATGSAEIHSGAGEIRVGTVDGPADLTTSNGTVHLGQVTGPARVKVDNGAVTVDRALTDLTATNANGAVRIGEVVRGTIHATTKNGRVEVGVRDGSAAWLELDTTVGRVLNDLTTTDAPTATEPVDQVRIHAATKLGDIVIHRVTRLDEQV